MTNIDKQKAAIRAEIHKQETTISRISNKIGREAAKDAFRPVKEQLMKQLGQLNDQAKINVLTGSQPAFDYGMVMIVTKTRGVEGVVERTALTINTKNDPNLFFMGHEIPAYLNRKLGQWTWGWYITDDAEALKTVLFEGYGDFKCLFASMRDKGGKALLVHNSCPFNDLEDLDIETVMDNKTQSMKCAKYLNRLLSSGDMNYEPRYGVTQEGSFDPDTNEEIIEFDNGATLIVKWHPLDGLTDEETASVDGHIDMSEKAHQVTGLTNAPKLGQSWGVTAKGRFFGKGHTRYVPGMSADIVIHGPKKLLRGKEFVFISLGRKKGGIPHTDIQSVTNYKTYGLTKELARKFMRYVYVSAHDERALIKAVMRSFRTPDEEINALDQGSDDVLRLAIQNGISPFAFPGLYRRATRRMLRKVMKTGAFRVPMSFPGTEIAISRYASGEPGVINEDGSIDMEKSLIPEGYICIPDLPDGIDVIIHRQPNENALAYYKLRNVHIPEYMEAAGQAVAFLGRGVQKVMYRLGGGDMDDNLIIIHDPEWVAHFDGLFYPETDKLVPVENPEYISNDEFGEYGLEPELDFTKFNTDCAEYQIDLYVRGNLSIGSSVNANMDDDIKSDDVNKASMIADLRARGLNDDADWLENERVSYTTAFMSTNLELIIDAAVKDPSLMEALTRKANEMNPDREMDEQGGVQGFIAAYHRAQRVYPYCMEGRIPPAKQKAGGYVLAMSEQCKAMEAIKNLQGQLDQLFTRNEWALPRKADLAFANLLSTIDAKAWVSGVYGDESRLGIRRFWSKIWTDYFASRQERDDAFAYCCDILDEHLSQVQNPADMEAIAVELYRQIYAKQTTTPVVEPGTGKVRPFGDGLLWTNTLANAFIRAIRKAAVGAPRPYHGVVLSVTLYLERWMQEGVHSIRVSNGVVFNLDGVAIGNVHPRLPEGEYKMEDGLLFIREADPALRPKDTIINMIVPLAAQKY